VPQPREADPALLFTELVLNPGETGSRTLRLVKATFRDGRLDSREELHLGDASEFGFQARYHVIGGRHVVLQTATVIDALEKRVLHTFHGGHVTAVEGTKVYFYNSRADGEEGVFCFDLATGRREKVAELWTGRWSLRGARSPDGSKAIVRELNAGIVPVVAATGEIAYGLALQRIGQPKKLLGNFAASCGGTGSGFQPDEPPGAWIDNDRFVTQTTLGTVVVLDTARGTQTPLVEIPLTHRPGEKTWETIGAMGFTPLGFQEPRFSLLPGGRVRYDADLVYLIDVERKTWEKAAWLPLGHGFEYAAVPEIRDLDRYSKSVTVALRHHGRVIGTSESVWWTTAERPRAIATEGYLAVLERLPQPGKQIPVDSIRLWSAATGEWQVLDSWADSSIGWIR
jgi:hypothetical protein